MDWWRCVCVFVCEDSLSPAVTGVNLTLDPSVIVLALMEAGTC